MIFYWDKMEFEEFSIKKEDEIGLEHKATSVKHPLSTCSVLYSIPDLKYRPSILVFWCIHILLNHQVPGLS